MTKEKAEKIVRGIEDKIEATTDIDDWAEFWGFTRDEYEEFLDMVTKAVEQKPYEKFESVKDHICKLAGDYKCWDNRLTADEALELCRILEQQPCEDCVSREEVEKLIKSCVCHDRFCSECNFFDDDAKTCDMKKLSSVTPAREKGKWIYDIGSEDWCLDLPFKCSNCKGRFIKSKYCPRCGADMREVKE